MIVISASIFFLNRRYKFILKAKLLYFLSYFMQLHPWVLEVAQQMNEQ